MTTARSNHQSAGASLPGAPAALAGDLRQMIAVLEDERQALASLDADGLIIATQAKDELCLSLEGVAPDMLDKETRPLAETARQLNEVNRQVRNLLAANVEARLEALGRFEPQKAVRLPQGRFGEVPHRAGPRGGYGSSL